MMPETIHTVSSSPGLCTCPAISAETMKMPDPIIEPQTIMVESKRPSPFTSSVWPPATPALGTAASAIDAALRNLRATARASNFRRDAQVLGGAFSGLARSHQIADHRDRIGACTIHRFRVFRCDSANRHDRFFSHGPRARDEFQTNHRVRIFLGARRKHGTDGNVIRRCLQRRAKLL